MTWPTLFQAILLCLDLLIVVAFLSVAILASNLPDLLRVPPPLPVSAPQGDALAPNPVQMAVAAAAPSCDPL